MGKIHNLKFFLLSFCCLVFSQVVTAQGLEDIIVETYYVSDANDATDADGGSLPVGSTTYRIYVDMAPGYELQAVYGNSDHTLRIETTTLFFNNEDRGEATGDAIGNNRLGDNTVALDSWLTLGAASNAHLGVLKSLDTDGSIIGGANNDGGSAGIAGGLLTNADPAAGIPLTAADGLIPGSIPSGVVGVGLPASPFVDSNDGPSFIVTGGAWSVLEGVVGPTPENQVLIAQITTDGDLSFELNVQIQGPGGQVEQYVSSNPLAGEQLFNGLTFPAPAVPGCTSSTACNFDSNATDDDGSCIEPVAGCQECNAANDGLVIVDTDGDGVCDADEVAGCTTVGACNYDVAATDDDGSCIIPVANCSACNATNDGLEPIDTDGDGVCDADEVPGCTTVGACNYDSAATDDDGSCIIPVADCSACNATNDGLVAIDTDGDGVCDADEVPGCTNPNACNYDATVDAGNDDGSCIVPVAGCSECSGGVLVAIDTDGDGVCDADEVPGCTDPSADNFNSAATDEDGSCTYGAVFACDGLEGGLEGIIVETYYVADANDATDTDGGGDLAEGSVTYRVYADLAAGYELQAVYGNAAHLLTFTTTTEWFNNEDRGEETGDAIGLNRWDDNTVALDSYLTLGATTDATLGVLKSEDTDGAIANGDGFLQNADPAAGIPLTVADGMIPGTLPSGVVGVGIDASMFGSSNSSLPFATNGGAYSVLEGVTGPTVENRVLIGQFTTSGDFAFELNLQVGAPDGSVEQYVARDAAGAERQCGELIFPGIPGCTDDTACNYDSNATFNDGSCIFPVADCSACDGAGGLTPIDDDGDGVCNADEVPGCSSPTACNYDATVDAANDDGSCIEPVADCQACNATNDGLVIIDTDGDGICNADEIPGCTNDLACNYDATATDDDGSCIVPQANCTACNASNDGLVLIDDDNDGVCNAQENPGCTSQTACNYDASATNDDGSCVEPVAGCSECDGAVLVIIDTDGDGVCDADEVLGCTNDLACNYDATATEEDGTCIVPEANCTECNATNDGLVIIDTDGDGTCDADENPGCNNPLACNFDPAATGDDGSCIVPTPGCTECNEIGYGGVFELVIIDTDGDGVCDADEVIGCTSPSACNFNPAATESDPTLCVEPVDNCTACDGMGGLVDIDTDGDGICDAEEIPGCTSSTACNYNPNATDDNGTCFEPVANCYVCGPNGSVILLDNDGDGICNADEVPGCTSEEACNYDPAATDDDGSCLEPIANCYECNANNDGLVILDDDGDGICNAYEIPGCQSATACNYNPNATDDDGSCVEPTEDCEECFAAGSTILVFIDTDGDGVCDADEVPGCTSGTACNYDATATDDDGSCIEPVADCSECNATNDGLDIIDTDGDGVCDADEVFGCTSTTACNYDASATEEDGSCLEPVEDCLTCYYDGMHWQLVLIDTDGDGVCNADDVCFGDDATGDPDGDGICADEEIFGCTNPDACNFDPEATEDDWSCVVPVEDCLICNASNTGLVLVDADNDGVCDANEVPGCTSSTACNYDAAATDDDGSCIEPVADCQECNATNDGLVIVDTDGDGVCDADEVPGCTSSTACNYDAAATDDDGSCLEPVADCLACNAAGNGFILIDSDGDGVCNANEVPGCTIENACNYDPAATDNDGSCIVPDYGCTECNPFTGALELVDSDGDGVCNADEVEGCTDANACNYDSAATDDDGSCIVPTPDCTACYTTAGGVTFLVQIDSDGDGICNANEVPGCTNDTATNYDPSATDDDGSCVFTCIETPSCQSFEGGLNGWSQVDTDDINWTLISGSTPSFYTGPLEAFDGDDYIYVEASFPNYPNKNAQLISPCYDLNVSSSANFAYHMQGIYDAVGSLDLSISTDNGMTWTSIFFLEGHQGINWNEATVDLSAYTGQNVRFRLSATTAFSWKGDIAVDNFCVVESILGCTDPTAQNYDPAATVDDGSCTQFSCTANVGNSYCYGFEGGLGDWAQSSNDAFDWTVFSGPTASWGTGPDAASEGNSYLYAEASYPNYPFKQAIINTPCFDFSTSTNPQITFDYHMFGTYVGAIYLQASTDGVSWSFVWYESGNQGNMWQDATVDLSAYAGVSQVQLRFIGQTAHGWQSDLAIDNVCVNEGASPMPEAVLNDAEIAAITEIFTKEYDGSEPLQDAEFAQFGVALFPNPTSTVSNLTINLTDMPATADKAVIIVRDLIGKVVFSTEIAVDGDELTRPLGLDRELANGTYMVSVQVGDALITERLVVAK
jgi:hypothetical protein